MQIDLTGETSPEKARRKKAAMQTVHCIQCNKAMDDEDEPLMDVQLTRQQSKELAATHECTQVLFCSKLCIKIHRSTRVAGAKECKKKVSDAEKKGEEADDEDEEMKDGEDDLDELVVLPPAVKEEDAMEVEETAAAAALAAAFEEEDELSPSPTKTEMTAQQQNCAPAPQ